MQTDLHMIYVKRYVSYFSKSVACLSAMLVDVPPLEYRILFNVCKAVVLSNHAPDDGNLYIRLENVRIANSLTGNTLIKSLARATCCLCVCANRCFSACAHVRLAHYPLINYTYIIPFQLIYRKFELPSDPELSRSITICFGHTN